MLKQTTQIFLTIYLTLSILPLSGWAEDAVRPEASETTPLEEATLPALIMLTLESNPELRVMQARWDAAKARIPQASALEDPMLAADFEGIPRGTADLSQYSDIEYMLQQTWPFPGKRALRGKAARKAVEMAEAGYRAKERDLIARLKTAHAEAILAGWSLRVNDEVQTILRQFVEIARVKYEVGERSQQDVLKAELELTKTLNDRITIEQRRATSVAKLNILMNRDPAATLSLATLEVPPATLWTWKTLQSLALESRPDLQGMKAVVEEQTLMLTLAKMEYLPDFTTRLEARQFPGKGLKEYDVQVGVNVPLWFWKKERYQVKEQQAEVEAARSELTTMKNLTLLEVQQAFLAVEAAHRQRNLYETTIIPQTRQTFESALANYRNNTGDFLTLLDAQRMVREAQLESYAVWVAYEQSVAELERAVGTTLPESALVQEANTHDTHDATNRTD